MAVTRTNELSDMLIRVEVGSGDDVSYKNRTLKYWAANTTDQNFLDFGTQLGALQTHTVNAIIRRDTAYLVDEG